MEHGTWNKKGYTLTPKNFGVTLRGKGGYTLIELLISVGIFILTTTAVTGIFFSSVRAQKEVALRQKLVADLQFSVEQIARDIRLMTVDYPAYAGSGGLPLVQPTNTLYLIDGNNIPVQYGIGNNMGEGCLSAESSPCIIKKIDADFSGVIDAGDPVESLTTNVMKLAERTGTSGTVPKLEFYIEPTNNPTITFMQPHVTIVVEVEGISNDARVQVSYGLETTTTSRMYEYCESGGTGCTF